MSSSSPVNTVPLGSARTTTSASTAEPRLARLRNSPVRRATSTETPSSVSTVFKKRFAGASRSGWPRSDSTRTIVGTTGGQRPALRNSSRRASDFLDRSESRPKPPLSSTSTFQLASCIDGPEYDAQWPWPERGPSSMAPQLRLPTRQGTRQLHRARFVAQSLPGPPPGEVPMQAGRGPSARRNDSREGKPELSAYV
jgi:hypothetical protein